MYYTDEDVAIFHRFVEAMSEKKSLPKEELVVAVASFFLETPYVASTLEKDPEGLVINLRELDCSTLVDNVVALCRMLKSEDHTFESFCNELRNLRYRHGTITDYTDRLHYTSDWLYENDRKRLVRDVNKEVGGIPLKIEPGFMSTHPDSYQALKGHPERIERISAVEREVARRSYHYIPKDQISARAPRIENGDVVCFTTAIKGLDISHVGIITRVGEKLTFIHASSLAKKVIVNEESLEAYVKKGKNSTGIMIGRPVYYSNNSKEKRTPNR